MTDKFGHTVSAAERYAERLAISLWEQHWKQEAPNWKPLSGDLIGLLTQIDNMVAGLKRVGTYSGTRPSVQDAEMERMRQEIRPLNESHN